MSVPINLKPGYKAWEIQSAAGAAHSKTWRKCAPLWLTRQRLGVRRSSASFHRSAHSKFGSWRAPFRFYACIRTMNELSRICVAYVTRICPGNFARYGDARQSRSVWARASLAPLSQASLQFDGRAGSWEGATFWQDSTLPGLPRNAPRGEEAYRGSGRFAL